MKVLGLHKNYHQVCMAYWLYILDIIKKITHKKRDYKMKALEEGVFFVYKLNEENIIAITTKDSMESNIPDSVVQFVQKIDENGLNLVGGLLKFHEENYYFDDVKIRIITQDETVKIFQESIQKKISEERGKDNPQEEVISRLEAILEFRVVNNWIEYN